MAPSTSLKPGPVGIYARFSSENQSERSIDDQVRRCRAAVEHHFAPDAEVRVFSDYALSGANLERPAFEAMMAAVEAGTLKAIVTEDISRISRDFADAAAIFKRLQYLGVPLIGVSDGIDTSAKSAKLTYTIKSLVADLYLDDLRDKTLRGMEGRALAGLSVGAVPYGYGSALVNANDPNSGKRLFVEAQEAPIVVRIFRETALGRSNATIARCLNTEGVPSPRITAGHKWRGWSENTIRHMLNNEKYVGVWRFGAHEWPREPGTNRRRPRPRNAADVVTVERPDLVIVARELWDEVQARRAEARARNASTGTRGQLGELTFRRSPYLFTGLLVCRLCGGSMTLHGGAYRYFRCATARSRGTCTNRRTVREELARAKLLEAIRDRLLGPEGLAYARERIAAELSTLAAKLTAEAKQHRAKLQRTETRLTGLVDFIAAGNRSEIIAANLQDLERAAKEERQAIANLEAAAQQPLRLPSAEEVERVVRDFDARLKQDPEMAREQMRRWLKGGTIRIGPDESGAIVAEGELLPLVLIDDGIDGGKSGVSGTGEGPGVSRRLMRDLGPLAARSSRSGTPGPRRGH